MAVANAGYLAAPAAIGVVRAAPVYAAAPIAAYGAPLVRIGRSADPGLVAAHPAAISYSSGIIRGAPVLAHPGLVRIGRSANPGLLAAHAVAPLAVARVAPVAYAAPAVPIAKTLAAPVYLG